MAEHRDTSGFGSPPLLTLSLGDTDTTAELTDDGVVVARQQLTGAGYHALLTLLERHREGFAAEAPIQPFDYWHSATERLLATVYELIARPLVAWCQELGAIALRFDHPLLAALPVETAHVDQEAALFEHVNISRRSSRGDSNPAARRRRFQLEVWIGDEGDLGAVALERTLVESAHTVDRVQPYGRNGSVASAERARLVHLAGHSPRVDPYRFDRGSEAHVVLSGCDSLPAGLPPGVASVTGSLWPVDDQTNVSLMAAFHARLARGLRPVEALRQAQILHRSLPPTTWAAYVHMGSNY